jgi:hypothetical protein
MRRHIHHAIHKLQRERCYGGPVSDRENPRAHGGIVEIDVCSCGAERRTNVNGLHRERGSWWRPETDEVK